MDLITCVQGLVSYREVTHIVYFITLHLTLIQGQSLIYSFTNCSSAAHHTFGASITSQARQFYEDNNLKCAARFMLPADDDMSFRVQLISLDLPPADNNICADNVTIWQTVSGKLDTTATKLMGPLCGDLDSIHSTRMLYSDSGSHILIVWATGPVVSGTHKGFQVILTAVIPDKVCSSYTNIRCVSSQECISSSLRCDGVANCNDQSDEFNCSAYKSSETISPSTTIGSDLPVTMTTTTTFSFVVITIHHSITATSIYRTATHAISPGVKSIKSSLYFWVPLFIAVFFFVAMVIVVIVIRRRKRSTQPILQDLRLDTAAALVSNNSTPHKLSSLVSTVIPPDSFQDDKEIFQEVDMVSIIVVGVLFVVILLVCVILACRSKSGNLDRLTDESNQLRFNVGSNLGYSEIDGQPATPPPTYSMIERQTSYVSQISMSSSQVSEPPDYDEALELDSQGNPIPRRNSSRNSSMIRHSSIRNSNGTPVRSASGYTRNRPRVQRYGRSSSAEGGTGIRYNSQVSALSEVVAIDENDTLDDAFFTGSEATTSENNDSFVHPLSSTPQVLEAGYDIEMVREDSMAPLFQLGSNLDSSDGQSQSDTNTTELDNAAILQGSVIGKIPVDDVVDDENHEPVHTT